MPRISEFYGIAIYMYHSDHAPPHFHAIYAEFEAEIEIGSWDILDGALPRRARGLVLDWAQLHQDELLENWDRARQSFPLNRVEPLQ
jgi:Domain of unknown function (DUF4160)